MIISISGRMKVGKDTAADFLVKQFGFKKIGLADSLKEILSAALNIPLPDFYDQSKKELPLTLWLESDILWSSQIDRILQEIMVRFPMMDHEKAAVDQYLRETTFKSLRDLMQKFGTECCRTNIDPDIWLKILESQIANSDQDLVCCDARFPNEREFFAKLGAKLWLIERNTGITSTHPSENQLGGIADYDHVFSNSSSFEDLYWLVSLYYTCDKHGILNLNLGDAKDGQDIQKTPRRRQRRNGIKTKKQTPGSQKSGFAAKKSNSRTRKKVNCRRKTNGKQRGLEKTAKTSSYKRTTNPRSKK